MDTILTVLIGYHTNLENDSIEMKTVSLKNFADVIRFLVQITYEACFIEGMEDNPFYQDYCEKAGFSLEEETFSEYAFDTVVDSNGNLIGYRNQQGKSPEEYDVYGVDEEGYNIFGYNEKGYNRLGYNEDGFNEAGFDIYGYDREGYDENGYDREGFNRKGLDHEGYNRYGDLIDQDDEDRECLYDDVGGFYYGWLFMDNDDIEGNTSIYADDGEI